ncbi:crotonyl-CoA carboxylase/reductase [Gandjariella thermophila]|uniref:crotonyl-CoA carboxylase/reductase n=1 Tax=Gandjariella thermophila TaxID=1931992 RepID=UPI001CEF77CD|nr:crotonyl-CoA carboxylase/reductase [Gandjariella thermophila]
MELGEMPPIGVVPKRMYAATVRRERYGEPADAIAIEVVDTPTAGRGQVLVMVMAAGINYNNIWASRGTPVDVVAMRRRRDPNATPFHIGGSEGSGIVWAVGEGVEHIKVGDNVMLSGCQWDETHPDVRFGFDPMFSETQVAWGYEANYGSFGQFALVADYQCHPMPSRLTWEEAACFLCTGATAYRQLTGWPPNTVRPGDPVLVWGGAGGLGSMASQITRALGGRPVSVVSNPDRADFCKRMGAVGVIDRTQFDHWGPVPKDSAEHKRWQAGLKAFGRAFWDALGERRAPAIVFEHPGSDTLPTSVFLCATGGMIVTCGATSGYRGEVDLRYLWMRQKRLQGSHYANLRECRAIIDLVSSGHVSPALGAVYEFRDIARIHQETADGTQPLGNNVVLVNAPARGLRPAG